ncbi:hypothetical protein [Kiloniella laminariae]|uniref:hypothetical protein n=1 Tax=Kiloniella laminariae TaxID=454162 RepID=UPI000362EFC7|nr:hypothetical protein [Kiloniella laminariae]
MSFPVVFFKELWMIKTGKSFLFVKCSKYRGDHAMGGEILSGFCHHIFQLRSQMVGSEWTRWIDARDITEFCNAIQLLNQGFLGLIIYF